jgi:hypothetical protein
MNEMQLLRRADPARTAPLDEVLSEQALQERLAGAQSSTEEAYPAAALGAPPARYRRRRRATTKRQARAVKPGQLRRPGLGHYSGPARWRPGLPERLGLLHDGRERA